MDAKQKTMLAAVLFLAWLGLAAWQWGAWKEPLRVPLTNVTGLASTDRPVRTKGSGLRVNLQLLTSARTEQGGTFSAPRNIFALPGSDGRLPVVKEAAPQVVQQEPSPERALLQQAVSAELGQYKYLGFLRLGEIGKNDKNIAVLSKNEEVVVGRVGDRVEEHLVLKAITPESVTIRNTDVSIDQTVPLSEEAPSQE